MHCWLRISALYLLTASEPHNIVVSFLAHCYCSLLCAVLHEDRSRQLESDAGILVTRLDHFEAEPSCMTGHAANEATAYAYESSKGQQSPLGGGTRSMAFSMDPYKVVI